MKKIILILFLVNSNLFSVIRKIHHNKNYNQKIKESVFDFKSETSEDDKIIDLITKFYGEKLGSAIESYDLDQNTIDDLSNLDSILKNNENQKLKLMFKYFNENYSLSLGKKNIVYRKYLVPIRKNINVLLLLIEQKSKLLNITTADIEIIFDSIELCLEHIYKMRDFEGLFYLVQKIQEYTKIIRLLCKKLNKINNIDQYSKNYRYLLRVKSFLSSFRFYAMQDAINLKIAKSNMEFAIFLYDLFPTDDDIKFSKLNFILKMKDILKNYKKQD